MSNRSKLLEFTLWLVVLFWGAHYVFGKWGMLGFDPLTFNVLRYIGVTPLLFMILYLLEKDIRIRLRDWPELALLGLFGITIYQTLFIATVKYASATNASLLLAASPVFTAIFAGMTGQDHMGRQGWIGSSVAFMGVILVLLFGTNKVALGMEVWRGNLLGILTSCVWGLYPIIADRTLKKYSALKTITYSSFFGTLFFLVLGAKSVLAITWEAIPWIAWGSLLFSIVPATAYGQVVWYYGISKLGVNHVMSYMYAVPVVAVLSAVILLDEQIHALQIIGAAVIFIGIYLIRKEKLNLLGSIEGSN